MSATVRSDWTIPEITAVYDQPLMALVRQASDVHRAFHDPDEVQVNQLLSIKTGACPEDCGYCSQSVHYDTGVKPEPLMDVEEVVRTAKRAQRAGVTRFCMGAAWREVKDGAEFDRVLAMVRGVKSLGLEACVTLGMLDDAQAARLKQAGLDFYNHNLDTGRSHYGEIVTTHTLDDRLATLGRVRSAGIRVCSGGILGMGESRHARAELLHELASLSPQPESVPINTLVPIAGTPLEASEPLDWSEVVRTVAAARLLMPDAVIRLSAGRTGMTEEGQALAFLAGANSIFVGDELLTTPNPEPRSDAALLAKLGLRSVAGCDARAASGGT
jgi:biotin synthase